MARDPLVVGATTDLTTDRGTAAPGRIEASYDKVARPYSMMLRGELAGKPLDRALLGAVLEMADGGPIADIGCGPGHVTAYLRNLGGDAIGIDISRSMIEIAREDHPDIPFFIESMTALQREDESISAAVLMFSIIHLSPGDRDAAMSEVYRVLKPGGVALVSFHIRSEEFAAGDVRHLTTWFGTSVDLEGHFLDPEVVVEEMMRAGLDVVSITTRMPHPDIEVQSERAYLLAQKPAVDSAD